MALTDFAFSPTDGLRNTATYPSNPVSGAAAREQVQGRLDEVKTYINGTLKTEVNKIDDKENKEITYVAVTASRTLTTDDLYKWIVATHASVPIVLTVPKDLTTDDAWIAIEQGGAAQVSVAAATDVTIKPATKLKVNGQDTAAALLYKGSNVWGWYGSVKA